MLIFDKISTSDSGEKLWKNGKQTNRQMEKHKRSNGWRIFDRTFHFVGPKSYSQRIILVKQDQEQGHSSWKIMVMLKKVFVYLENLFDSR